MARGAGVRGVGADRRSTGLAGGPVPTNFGRASGARGFCREQGMRSACFQGSHGCPGWAVGFLAHRGAVVF